MKRLLSRAVPDRCLRVVATGFCFLLFGLGGLAILCAVFPLLRLRYPDVRESRRSARDIIHRSFAWFVRVMVACGTISYEVRNRERLARRGLLVVANHPSLIDVVLLVSLLRQPNCVVKASLAANLFTRGPVRSAGFIVNTEGPRLVDDCIASARAGDNLVIFPEGTRSPTHDGALCPMKRGAANIALRGNLALTPVVITVSEPMLGKGQRWYQAPRKRPHFILTVMDDITVAENDNRTEGDEIRADARNRTARALTHDLGIFFSREIRHRVNGGAQNPRRSPTPRA
ncbi:MAG: 1-acyl-sn-glycerol-3-phosphate acyltransferase [Candidatus Accumulibacter sp.]|jgi:1-acyl-sn-glycerol-3-phosphate acyltransferase|nr:1-acyl-sn-glycerol-3-phosphate acyltransferase [Accumulibacter sp.]